MKQTQISLPQAVLEAARAAGGEEMGAGETKQGDGLVAYLKAQALTTPGSFLTLLGKVGMGHQEAVRVQARTGNEQEQAQALPPIIHIELVAPHIKIDEHDKSEPE